MKNIVTRLSSLLLSILIIIQCSGIAAAGMRFPRMGYGGGYEGLGTFYQFEQADKKLKELQRELAMLRNSRVEFLHISAKARATKAEADRLKELQDLYNDDAGIDAEITRQQAVLTTLQGQVAQLASGRPQVTTWQLMARGLSGENDFFMFGTPQDGESEFWYYAKQGLTLGITKEFSDFIRIKMRGVFQDKLGPLFDATVNGISDGFERIKDVFLHDSKRPFTEIEVGAWQAHIKSIFDEIERITKDGLRDAYRSQDMTMRQTGPVDDLASGMDDAKEQEPSLSKAPVRIWADLFGGYVLQLSYYILVLQDRKGYYELDSFEVFFATHLEERLQQFCNLLLKVNDLSDLDTHLAANKAVIPAYKSNVENLFKQLQQEVKIKTFTTAQTTSLFDREKPRKGGNRYADDLGYDAGMNDYPQSAWGSR